MKFLVLPDSFKDCLSAKSVGDNLKKGILSVFPKSEVKVIPVADGGEGTLDAIMEVLGGRIINVQVHDPLLRQINACFGILPDKKTAIIEMAKASGLELLRNEERNPWVTSSYGTGELIKAALDHKCTKIIVGLGGSATNDAGVGMLQALGLEFTDINGEPIGHGGGALSKIHQVNTKNLDRRIITTEFIAATDIFNPLTGSTGASLMYSQQKGASPEMAIQLENNMLQLLKALSNYNKTDISGLKGGGAAGGMGAALAAFLNAKIKLGFELVSELINLEKEIINADVIIGAEGTINEQNRFGKTPIGIGKIAKKQGKPVVIFTGNLSEKIPDLQDMGICAIIPITQCPVDLDEAIRLAPIWLQKTAMNFCYLLELGNTIVFKD